MKLISLLYHLGAHIGHHVSFLHPTQKQFLLGLSNKHSLINLQHTVFFLKKTCSFFFFFGEHTLYLCFHISNLYTYNWNLKSYFMHEVVFQHQHSFLFEKWKNGCFSNYKTQVIDILESIYVSSGKKSSFTKNLISPKNYKVVFIPKVQKKKKKIPHLGWIDFLIQILFFIKSKQITGLTWSQEWNRVCRFWRFYHYFKCYFYFFNWPDCFVLINNKNKDSIVSEINRKKIPIVGVCDTNSSSLGISYFIPSNDDSILLQLFYFKLFLNSYKKGSYSTFLV